MIALVIALSSIGLTALLGMLGYFLTQSLRTLEDVRKKVSEHGKTDAVVIERVSGLDTRMGTLERKAEKIEDRLLSVELGVATIDGKLDKLLERV